MSVYSKFETFLGTEPYKAGRLGGQPLRALRQAYLDLLPVVSDLPEPSKVTPTNALSETAQTIKSGPGKLLFVRLVSPAAANDDAVVSFFDNSVLRFAVRLKQKQTAEVCIFTDRAAGTEYDTNLTVSAKKADNSTNLDAADRPTCYVLVSDQ
jgi:hypothetical protein